MPTHAHLTMTEDAMTFLRDAARTMHATVRALASPPRRTPARQEPTEAEVLNIVREVGAHAAKLTARAMAQQRAFAVRDLARDCARLAERVDRCRLTGADSLRQAAERYAHVADNLDAALLRCPGRPSCDAPPG